MTSKKWTIRLLTIVGFLLTFVLVNAPGRVYADSYAAMSELIADKAVFQGVNKCYNGYVTTDKTGSSQNHPSILKSFNLEKYTKFSDLLTSTAGGHSVAFVTGLDSSFVGGKYRSWVKSNGNVTCDQLFRGSGADGEVLLRTYGKKSPDANDVSSTVSFLEDMGYTSETSSTSDSTCFTVNYKVNHVASEGLSSSGATNQVCLNSNGGLSAGPEVEKLARDHPFFVNGDNGKVCLSYYHFDEGRGFLTSEQDKDTCMSIGDSSGFNAEWAADFAKQSCANNKACANGNVKFSVGDGGSMGNKSSITMRMGNPDNASVKAVSYISGNENYNSLSSIALTPIEKRILYQYYLEHYYGVSLTCPAGAVAETNHKDKLIDWLDMGTRTMIKCEYDTSNARNKNKKANGITSKGFFKKGSIKGLDDMLKKFKKLEKTYSEEELASVDDIMMSQNNTGEETSTCESAGGAGSLGWIVCPIMEGISNFAVGFYNGVLEPQMQMDPELFTGSNDATADAWSTFRDIANVLFVVILLVVIFSQLTGVGIDNYGIKKILPKLIVMAVLINLSYILALLALDVSNILGNGLQAMFNSMAEPLQKNLGVRSIITDAGETTIDAVGMTGLTGVGILAFLSVAGVAIWASPMVLISLLVGGVGVLISLIFLFVLLAARKAAVVAMVVMSPIAVVMYALPNTKKLFDKWLKLFEGLLLVYPISSLLVGAGGYVSTLLMASNFKGDEGFMYSFTAIIISIAPVFFIPTVLKGSFAAMGKIGGAIAGFGDKARSGATRGIRNSDAYKNTQERMGELGTLRKAGLKRDKNGNYVADDVKGLRKLIRGGDRNIARNRARFLEDQKKRSSSERLLRGSGFDAAMAGLNAKMADDEVDDMLANMENGGFSVMDENNVKRQEFTVPNIALRMSQLEKYARDNELSAEQQLELRALARGLASRAGGGGKLGGVIRKANADGSGNGVNTRFMKAMGAIYSQDSTVRGKLDEKDAGAAAYTEQFMNGGTSNENFDDFKANYKAENPNDPNNPLNYQTGIIDKRMKTYSAGLNQGGDAQKEYVDGLSDNDIRSIVSDQRLYNSLDNSARKFIDDRYSNLPPDNTQQGGNVAPGGVVSGGATNTGTPSANTTGSSSSIIIGGNVDGAARAAGYNDSNAARKNNNNRIIGL